MKLLLVTKEELEQMFNDVVIEIRSLIVSSNTKKENENDWLTSAEVKRLLKISHTTLWKWENKNYIISHQISGRKRYKKSDVLAALTKREVKKF